MRAEAAISAGGDWRSVLESMQSRLSMPTSDETVDLVLLFASDAYADEFNELVAAVRWMTGARVVVGCSGSGIIGPHREIEDEPAISLQLFSLPGADLRPVKVSQMDLMAEDDAWLRNLPAAGDLNAWLMFADPFSIDSEALLKRFSELYDGKPLIGGLASGNYRRRKTFLFLDDEVLDDGAVALSIGGAFTVKSVVSQGCAPIGETWTITAAEGNVIQTIGMRPALEVLVDTFQALPPETQERARSNLLIGLAMNEYRDEFGRGDFLIRNLMGVDHQSGSITVGAEPRVGQTLQFQLRDAEAADDELVTLLNMARNDLSGDFPAVGALLCCCNGRGAGLFGESNHDVRKLEEVLGPMPVAGFFCNGEIGPVGGQNFLHGFTASLALIIPV
ncbi:MAG: FIST N-terminal domain-containing protein [Dehalococcoidia bacterium]